MAKLKIIPRDFYLQQLIDCQENGLIKIISGVRRCGKSFLLFELFQRHLLGQGVKKSHIITHRFDDPAEASFSSAEDFFQYIKQKIKDKQTYYLLLDEIQLLPNFEKALNGFLYRKNLDVYVTGSNARFLVSDVITEFRGRSYEIRVFPLSLAEFYTAQKLSWPEAVDAYLNYGGMPQILSFSQEQMKINYLRKLVQETYLRDIIERYKIRNDGELAEVFQVMASNVGGLTNPTRLAHTFSSVKKISLSTSTIERYLQYFENAFLLQKVIRYDIKGKKYINTPAKYYFVDPGLRNACLAFRQTEIPHLLENVVYTDLVRRGYQVDVGLVRVLERTPQATYSRRDAEVDLVASMASKRYYIQVAMVMPTADKITQEKRSLRAINDVFRQIIVMRDQTTMPYQDEDGILMIGLRDFILHPEMWE